jgi:tRNA(fMet)-specific endonuclease VapC
MKKVLLDTNAYSRYLAGDDRVFEVLVRTDIVVMSVVVLAELFTGFKGGRQFANNSKNLRSFLRKPSVQIIHITEETAEIFADLKHALRVAGTPIPINDLWIAANSMETGSELITFDKHFRHIAGLRIWEYT